MTVTGDAVGGEKRYPVEPLLRRAEVSSLSMLTTRARLRVGGGAYRHVLVDGLSAYQADRWAVRLGFHPAEVWPDWSEDVLATT